MERQSGAIWWWALHATPRHIYFYGGSEGGREGLAMPQRFPADFDGIVSVAPVINWVALQATGARNGIALMGAGRLSAAKVGRCTELCSMPATRAMVYLTAF
jgi:tannase/feruloyl esterase